MSYEWYREIPNDQPITQGDIIIDCPVVEITGKEESPFINVSLTELRHGIVMTQACDLENGKVENLTVCELVPFIDVLNGVSIQKYNNPFRDVGKEKKEKIVMEFKQGNVLNHHLLNKYEVDENKFTYHTVSLKESFNVPIKEINEKLKSMGGSRLQLLPPYREQLAQSYARVFMRIGYPIDLQIDVNAI